MYILRSAARRANFIHREDPGTPPAVSSNFSQDRRDDSRRSSCICHPPPLCCKSAQKFSQGKISSLRLDWIDHAFSYSYSCNRSTGWFGELRPRMFGQHSQVRTATSGEGQRLPYSLGLWTTTSGVGQRLQYSWVPRRCKRRLREESELQSGRLRYLFCVDPPCAVTERTTVETDLGMFQYSTVTGLRAGLT